MKQSAYEKARDQRVADEAEPPIERALMCPAAGCPRRWSVAGDRGRGCSAHYWADPREWPRITEHLVAFEADRVRYGAAARPEPEPVPLEMRKAAVACLASYVESRAGDPRAWARELQRRHLAGEPLRPDKVDAYRRVLRLEV